MCMPTTSAQRFRRWFNIVYKSGLEIVPFLQSGRPTAKKCAGMATFVIRHSDELANLRAVLIQRFFSRNVSFHSGMAVFLPRQSCGLACCQRFILPLQMFCVYSVVIISSRG